MIDSEKIEVLIPRCFLSLNYDNSLEVDNNGLTAVQISWKEGLVTNIKPIENSLEKLNQILFPRFVEPHAHFDKAFTWKKFPNYESNYENALSLNIKEHSKRTIKNVITRAEKSIKLSIENGYRAIRTHIDTYELQDKLVWEELFKIKKKYSDFLKLQFVALAPLEFWNSRIGEELAKKYEGDDFVLGGVVVPPFNKKKIINLLSKMLILANKYNLEIDLHIDESSTEPGFGINTLLRTIDDLNTKVSVTCSHLSSLLFLKENQIYNIANEIAEKNIKVIALPLTNFWLLNNFLDRTTLKRPVAPIKQLQRSCVDVAIGSDNVQDPWYPFGNFDPFYLMSCTMPL